MVYKNLSWNIPINTQWHQLHSVMGGGVTDPPTLLWVVSLSPRCASASLSEPRCQSLGFALCSVPPLIPKLGWWEAPLSGGRLIGSGPHPYENQIMERHKPTLQLCLRHSLFHQLACSVGPASFPPCSSRLAFNHLNPSSSLDGF